MQKRGLRFLFALMGIVGAMMLVGFGVSFAVDSLQGRRSLGIIGGADGPTAIFVASRAGFPLLPLIAVILVVIGTVGCLCLRRRGGRR